MQPYAAAAAAAAAATVLHTSCPNLAIVRTAIFLLHVNVTPLFSLRYCCCICATASQVNCSVDASDCAVVLLQACPTMVYNRYCGCMHISY
jgi:hypothetical protein